MPAVTHQGAPESSTNRVIDSDSAVQCVCLAPIVVNARKLSVHWKISQRLKPHHLVPPQLDTKLH